ncbi:MAG: lipopolysaccharide heptosyltransferase II [Deltaproteobacteria bacterium]|nr:lipopolysaccharide heptosyltransferase II [Deltaproteobacteria bacterium]
MRDNKPILVRAPNWIGDAVMCLPALEALHRLYPASAITVVAKPRVAPVFRHCACIKDIIEYDDKGGHRGIVGRLKLASGIRSRRFGKAVLFQNAFDAAFLSFVSGIPERIGYGRDLRSALLTKAVKLTPEIKKRHQTLYYLNIVAALGARMPDAPPLPCLRVPARERARAERFLKERGIYGRVIIGAAPGASYGPAKMWPPGHFASALNALAKTHGAYPVIFGGPDDKAACNAVSSLLTVEHANLAGELSLGESIALMGRASIFITNDSGPMHLASALGVPTIAVFGSTDAVITGPLGKRAMVMSSGLECSPCFKRECRYGHYRCLREITAEAVVKEAGGLLKTGRRA